jgi:cytochrome c553
LNIRWQTLLFIAGLLLGRLSGAAASHSAELTQALRATPDLARGEALFINCTSCHSSDGGGEANGTVPRIAGQYPSVLIKELVDFRYGQRWDLRMERIASRHRLADAQAIADVAYYAASLHSQLPPAILDGEQLTRGARVFVQLCSACHGATGLGDAQNQTPRLAGQHASYLLRQMQETASGGRPNMNANHIRLLNRLDFEDYQGIADYLARISPAQPGIPP